MAHEAPTRLDVLTRHRLRMLGLDAEVLASLSVPERLETVYRRFLARVPYENLSTNRACLESKDPTCWPRPTDRLLRENRDCGLGGTSFALSYALRDLFRGVGGNAHCTFGQNLVTEEAHAAVVVYGGDDPLLFDPALLVGGPVPVRPGGECREALGCARLEAYSGASLTMTLQTSDADRPRRVYQVVPLPSQPQKYRQAWIASHHKGRPRPLRLARRNGDEIVRYGERAATLEILRPGVRLTRKLDGDPVRILHELFAISEPCLDAWFRARAGTG